MQLSYGLEERMLLKYCIGFCYMPTLCHCFSLLIQSLQKLNLLMLFDFFEKQYYYLTGKYKFSVIAPRIHYPLTAE